MAAPEPDPIGNSRPVGLSTGCNILFALIIFLLIAGLVFWGWQRNPPDTPAPAATGNPSGPPAGNAS